MFSVQMLSIGTVNMNYGRGDGYSFGLKLSHDGALIKGKIIGPFQKKGQSRTWNTQQKRTRTMPGNKGYSLHDKCFQRDGRDFLYTYVIYIYWSFLSKNARNTINFCSAKWFSSTFEREPVSKVTHKIFMLWLAPELEEEELLFKNTVLLCMFYCILTISILVQMKISLSWAIEKLCLSTFLLWSL